MIITLDKSYEENDFLTNFIYQIIIIDILINLKNIYNTNIIPHK